MQSPKKLHADLPLTQIAHSLGLHSWQALVSFVENLPYGRNANRYDFGLVLQEQKGTCSSKHALLRKIAEENRFDEVQQIMGIYKMTDANNPGVGDTQLSPSIGHIPEAHSYLKIDGVYHDYTNKEASYDRIRADVMEEMVINPEDVIERKVEMHRAYIEQWINENNLELDLEAVWSKREACIRRLSGSEK